MQCNRVDRFNAVVGNQPSDTVIGVLAQMQRQIGYLLEEVNETLKAAKEGDIIEVVDGIADVEYVAAYLKTLSISLGVDQEAAYQAVCDNNDEKFTTSRELAYDWWTYHSRQGTECYISEKEYEGHMYFTVRRMSDNKVLKYEDFPKVDLTPYIPKELLA